MLSKRRPLSLAARLAVGASLWCGVALVIAGFLLTGLFREHVTRKFDADLHDHMVHLVSIVRKDDTGDLIVDGSLSGARFSRPFSGWAWQVRRGEDILAQSPSLGPAVPGIMEVLSPPPGKIGAFDAPGEVSSRGLSRSITLRDGSGPLIFAVSRPQAELDQSHSEFRMTVLITLAALGLGLVATIFILMRIALRPLLRLKDEVAAMREGDGGIKGTWPQEIQPVVEELATLRLYINRMVERARGQASDLAHAVKTPLSVLRQLSTEDTETRQAALLKQVDRISAYLDRHLGQSRAAGTGVRNTQTPISEPINDIVLALTPQLEHRGIRFEQNIEPNLIFTGDESDLYEIVGNLVDNAAKWARSQISIDAHADDTTLTLVVTDDGPGVPSEQADEIFSWGKRLDQTVPGQGLGLTIVRDLVGLYHGTVEISESETGGARVRIVIPNAARRAGPSAPVRTLRVVNSPEENISG